MWVSSYLELWIVGLISVSEIRPRPGYQVCRVPQWKICTSREKPNISKREASVTPSLGHHVACLYIVSLDYGWCQPPHFLLGSILLHILDTVGIIFFLFCILLAFPSQFFWLCAIPSVDKPLPLHWTFCSRLPSPPLFTEYSEPLLTINLSPSVDLPPWDKCLRMELLEQRPKHLYGSPDLLGY